MKQMLLLVLVFLLFTPTTQAQESPDSSYWQAYALGDIGLSIGHPAGPFKRSIDRGLFGWHAAALINFQKAPGIFGGIGISNYRFYNTDGIFPLAIDGYTADYDVNSWVTLLNLHWTFRVMPPWQRRFTPYIEASVGTKRIGVRSEVYFLDDDQSEEEPIETYFQAQDWGFSYGGAAGLACRLTSWGENDLLLQLSVHYYPGTTLDYYVPNDTAPVVTYEPLEAYESKFSTSDLWQVNIGLTFALGSNYAIE